MTITLGAITAGGITNGGILAGGILASQAGDPYRDYAFYLDDTTDKVSGNSLSCLIPGTRYDLVNGVQTAFTTNTPVITEKGVRTVGAYQNLCTDSNDFSLWEKGSAVLSLDLGTDNFWTANISETGFSYIREFYTPIEQDYTFSVTVKKGTLRYVGLRCLEATTPLHSVFDFESESFIVTNSHTGFHVKKIAIDTYIISTTNDANNISYYSICGTDVLGLENNIGTSGTILFKNAIATKSKYPLPYIPTTTTAVASVSESGTVVAGEATNGIFADEIASNFTLLNSALQNRGTLTLDWTPGYSAADVTGSLNILSFDGSTNNLKYNQATEAIELYDGTNTASKAITLVANTTYEIQCTWQGSSMQVCVDGSAGATTTFGGSFNPGSDLVLGLSNPELQYIKNLRVLKVPQWV